MGSNCSTAKQPLPDLNSLAKQYVDCVINENHACNIPQITQYYHLILFVKLNGDTYYWNNLGRVDKIQLIDAYSPNECLAYKPIGNRIYYDSSSALHKLLITFYKNNIQLDAHCYDFNKIIRQIVEEKLATLRNELETYSKENIERLFGECDKIVILFKNNCNTLQNNNISQSEKHNLINENKQLWDKSAEYLKILYGIETSLSEYESKSSDDRTYRRYAQYVTRYTQTEITIKNLEKLLKIMVYDEIEVHSKSKEEIEIPVAQKINYNLDNVPHAKITTIQCASPTDVIVVQSNNA